MLDRLYLADGDWVVKGATALMARDLGTRGTIDIDLYRAVARELAEADLRRAAATDIGDWFRFEVGAGSPVGNAGVRLPVTSVVGATTWVAFHVDLIGSGLRMTGQPEDVPPLARGAIPEVAQHGYKAYPLVDHVADKVAATYERYGRARMPSTRYRDLVDLVSIVTGTSVEAGAQRVALASEFERRQLPLPRGLRRARPAPLGSGVQRGGAPFLAHRRAHPGRRARARPALHRPGASRNGLRSLGPRPATVARTVAGNESGGGGRGLIPCRPRRRACYLAHSVRVTVVECFVPYWST